MKSVFVLNMVKYALRHHRGSIEDAASYIAGKTGMSKRAARQMVREVARVADELL